MPGDRPPPAAPLRQLPRVVRPFPDETLDSYLDRLAHANWLERGHLSQLLRHGNSTRRSLADLTGITESVLGLAIPSLPGNEHQIGPTQGRPIGPERAACRRCAQRRCPDWPYPRVARRHEDVLCAAHRIWLGRTDSPTQQLNLHDCYTDLAAAAHRHRRLIRQHGRATVRDTYQEARTLALSYAHQRLLPGQVKQRRVALRQQAGTDNLHTVWDASLYPTAVALTAILVAAPRGTRQEDLPPEQIHTYRRRLAADVTDGHITTSALDAFFRLSAKAPWPTRPDTR